MSPSDLPLRPPPRAGAAAALHEWVRWIGPARLVASALSMAVVVAGAWWLVRSPAPSVESTLPVASSPAGTAPAGTLPPPSTSASQPAVPSGSSSPTTPAPTVVVVHVAGAVAGAGLYVLPPGSRVGDAVQAAGGAAPDAELDGVNLAAPVADGQRVYVPRVGEVDPASIPAGPAPDPPVADTSATTVPGPIDLNVAGVDELQRLPGIGPALAAAIVDDRERNGPFASVDDLDRVSGIGPAKLERLRDRVRV
jgi:competence protein ComEA